MGLGEVELRRRLGCKVEQRTGHHEVAEEGPLQDAELAERGAQRERVAMLHRYDRERPQARTPEGEADDAERWKEGVQRCGAQGDEVAAG